MKLKHWLVTVVVLAGGAVLVAATTHPSAPEAPLGGDRPLIAEGWVHVAHLRDAQGWTSDPSAGAMLTNERRYGKLYSDVVVVTKPDEKGWGVLVIPTSALTSIRFHAE